MKYTLSNVVNRHARNSMLLVFFAVSAMESKGSAIMASDMTESRLYKGFAGTVDDQQTITGKVSDGATGQALVGVSVVVKGSAQGVSTDEDGRYSIQAPSGSILVFSSIGYMSREISVSNTQQINVSLQEDIGSLEEIVVQVGYGSMKQREITSSVAHVDTSQFRQSGSRNALDLIQGKVPGLQVTRTSGSNPNSSPAVQLRGVVTVTGSASPLYVIDGIPGGNMDLLQQDDILSIDVLKDGSGAAIYGSSANAGVILVTTKKGKAGEPSFSYSSYARKEYLARRPNTLSPQEFRDRIASGDIDQEDFGHSTDFYDKLINHGNISHNHNFAMSG